MNNQLIMQWKVMYSKSVVNYSVVLFKKEMCLFQLIFKMTVLLLVSLGGGGGGGKLPTSPLPNFYCYCIIQSLYTSLCCEKWAWHIKNVTRCHSPKPLGFYRRYSCHDLVVNYCYAWFTAAILMSTL